MSMAARLQGLWVPGWYNLDTSIAVGQVDDFHLFSRIPELQMSPEDIATLQWPDEHVDLVFYNSILRPDQWKVQRLRVESIHHPQIGAVLSIDTASFGVYEFRTSTKNYRVEAEEEPGRCWDDRVKISTWAVRVGLSWATDE